MTLLSYPLAVGILIALMVATVVASGVLESHDPKRRRHTTSPGHSQQTGAETMEPLAGEPLRAGSGTFTADAVTGVPAAGSPIDSLALVEPVAVAIGGSAAGYEGEVGVHDDIGPGEAPEVDAEATPRGDTEGGSEVDGEDAPEVDPEVDAQVDGDSSASASASASAGAGAGASTGGRPKFEPGSTPHIEPSQAMVVLVPTAEPDALAFQLGPLGVDSELAAVFFAAYVASGAPEWSRVTGWVTAPGEPPALGIGAGDRLRGKPAQVCALLECSHDGRNWVVLDHQTNIDLALERRPPHDDVLAGLVEWWHLTTSSHPRATSEAAMSIRTGVAAVVEELRGHPLESVARLVLDAATVASDSGSGLEERIVSAGSLDPVDVPPASEAALSSRRGNAMEPHH